MQTRISFSQLFAPNRFKVNRGAFAPVSEKDIQKERLNRQELNLTVSEIKIPRLQRDYAQGRSSENIAEIRAGLLSDLFDSVDDDVHRPCLLNFIYGKFEKIEDVPKTELNAKACLLPLDGQQRLTTLYLLHWYARLMTDDEEIRTRLQFVERFSYATRFPLNGFAGISLM